MSQAEICDPIELQSAFQTFNETSEELSALYSFLEQRVGNLNSELAALRSERLSHLQEQERLASRFQGLLQALPGGVVVLDGEGRVQESNPAAQEVIGEALDGLLWRDIVARIVAPRPDDGHDITLRNGRCVNISTQSLGYEPGQVLLIKDVTETRQLQEQLSRHKRLSAMGEMVASIAHQIRTPIASTLLYASNLNRVDLDTDKARRFTGRIVDGLNHLEQLVVDMLQFARGSTFELDDIRLSSLLSDLQQSVAGQLSEHNFDLSVDSVSADIRLCGNHDALLSALRNLVDNAIHACGDGGRLHIGCMPTGAGTLELQLTDNGPGIPAQERERIFEPFYTTRAQGTGLGLPVVRSIIRAHNGHVRVADGLNGGCLIGIQLPAMTTTEQSI